MAQVVDLLDDSVIVPVLEADRHWAAYALCDLDSPYRAQARYLGLTGQNTAVILIYSLPGRSVFQPCGDPDTVRAILRVAPDLPTSILLSVRPDDLPTIEERYVIEDAWTMFRMIVKAEELRPSPAVKAALTRLTTADLPALQRLYGLWRENAFTASMLEHGIYYGAYRNDVLVAAAGTHAVSPRHGMAAIGGVFTHPEHRGQGLATAVTGAVARTVVEGGIREIALNVRTDNAPALAAYRRLGFVRARLFHEGHASLRPS